MSMPCCVRAGSKTAAAPHGACIVRNVDLLVAYPGSSVELARDLGCFEHLIIMYYDMISSVLRDGYRSTIPFPGLYTGGGTDPVRAPIL